MPNAARLKYPHKGRMPNTLYQEPDADKLIALGVADSQLSLASDYTAFTTNGSADDASRPIHTVADTTWIINPADGYRELRFTSSSAVTVTVPSHLRAELPRGIIATIRQDGTGQVTVVGEAGMTITSSGATAKTAGQYSVIQVDKTTPTTASVLGSVAAT